MKYCINYYGGCSVIQDVDEIKIKWHSDDTEEGLDKFITDRVPASKRLIIDITEVSDEKLLIKQLPLFEKAMEKCNFTVLLSFDYQKDVLLELVTRSIPYFFCEHASGWNRLNELCEAGATDFYITDSLGFDLVKVSEFCKSKHRTIRVFPNVAQSTIVTSIPGITGFFIRPEDEFIYQDLVDVYEFWGPLNKQPVLMKIYQSHKWLGNLNNLILNLGEDIDSPDILPYFAEARTKCQHRCVEKRCNVCPAIVSLGKAMKENNKWVRIEYPNDKKPIDK